ncbi:Transcription factor BOA15 [Colletotrichum trifolii]|uniref:Transcription factor BOA15 n=1 Tax=Colletotrichum trifolii TaxID=5466 RepID=A0A4R8RCU9_COLTR|nr:Transcription factor BOA15 [Colletotrichum trifolii]
MRGQLDSTPSTTSGVSGDLAAAPGFPDTFFLDTEDFQPISHDKLYCTAAVPQYVSELLGLDAPMVCERYFDTVDLWFPFVSRKKLRQDLEFGISADVASLLLCMKLATEVPFNNFLSADTSPTYEAARRYATTLEVTFPMSLRVLQSLVLIATYEVGHGIFPTAYLTVGRAARLGLLRGVHDRKNVTQIFQTPPTWTHWEEERRTWWAITILERYMNLGPKGLALATPEPVQGELLPASDADWFRGALGTSQPLFTMGFSTDSEVGPFARVCQASHILGRVLSHRNSKRDGMLPQGILDEAAQLDATLTALDAHLAQASADTASAVDVALCTVARLNLFQGYACIQPGAVGERLPAESEMQKTSVRGLKHIIAVRAPTLALTVLQQGAQASDGLSPLLIQVLYDIATECQWLIREGEIVKGADSTLSLAADALKLLSQRWSVAAKCLKLLEKSGGL